MNLLLKLSVVSSLNQRVMQGILYPKSMIV